MICQVKKIPNFTIVIIMVLIIIIILILKVTDMETQLNLQKLKDLIKVGIASIPKDEECEEAILVIGDTGVGKSTIMNFLYGSKLIVKA